MIPMYIAGKVSSEAKDRVKSLIARLGLADRMDHFPDGLSGGQQQRIAVVRALANDPPLVVADEPTGNLDTDAGLEIIELFSALAAGGKAILLVTHDIDLAQAAHTRYVLRQGRLHMSLNEASENGV